MAQFIINGISISFPYQPYEVQEEYMKNVIACLTKGVNGMLESPTGTGKTLSLLCSSLAWLETKKAQQQLTMIERSANKICDASQDLKLQLNDISGCWDTNLVFTTPKIIYSSRTHSQLSQAVQELKRSNYKHMKSVVLGSRDQLCLHPDVIKLPNHTAKLHTCHAKINNKSCPFFLNYEEKIISSVEYQETPVTDIEDLVKLGKKYKVCPYYAARKLKNEADVIFTPYNYIIDPKSRRAHGTELQGNVLIFDEAHNIESACEESLSFQLRSYDLALCITEVSETMEMIKDFDSKCFNSSDNGAPDFTLTDLSILKVMFCELEEILDKDIAECTGSNVFKPGDYLIEVLSKVELTPEKKEVVVELLEKIILYHFTSSNNSVLNVKGTGLQKFCDLLNVLYSKSPAETNFKQEFSTNAYKVCMQYETQNRSKSAADPWSSASKKKQSWTLDFWCFSSSVRMQEIVGRGVHSIILTSGTLSPLGPIIAELGVDFPVQLENPHIIKDSQVFVAVVTCGPDGTPLNSSYQNRSSEAYVRSLGRSVCNFRKLIPDGLLIFYPSYSLLKSNQESWEDNGIWKTLAGIKPVFTEPQGRNAFQESIEKYYSTIEDPLSKGATLMAVCRGKVSEGLDFADQNARGVVITGLPFPPIFDPRVKLKMEYLNEIAKANKGQGVQGNDWYLLQASRSVNQAIGRVIRHKNDFGAILLCDNRFREKRIQEKLSKWLRGHITVFDSFGPVLRHLSSFFRNLDQESLKPKPDVKHMGSFRVNGSVLCSTSIRGQHSGSSQHTEPTMNTENIIQDYKTENDEGLLSSCKKFDSSSIFDEFQKIPIIKSYFSSTSGSSSTAVNETGVSFKYDQPKEPKRRKISVKLRSVEGKETTEMWKKYLLEIKSVLTSDGYKRFCVAVKAYKAEKDAQKFAMCIENIFLKVPEKHKYIQTASLLVDSKDREQFFCTFKNR